jgi:hypothetical protein
MADAVLRACPFCGGEPFFDSERVDESEPRVSCPWCLCFGPIGTSGATSVAAWNSRAVASSSPTTLPRCPFCAGKPVAVEAGDPDMRVFFIDCDRCHASGPLGDTEDEAKGDWTRRASENLSERSCTELLTCPSCGRQDAPFALIDYRLVRCSPCGATIRVTGYRIVLGRPGDPHDLVEFHGLAERPARQ